MIYRVFRCPHCGTAYRVPATWLTSSIDCVWCNRPFRAVLETLLFLPDSGRPWELVSRN